jgi:anti-sigma regulatory factor (Ser/Thr protein kinase)
MKRESWLPAAPESAAMARAIVREAAVEQGLDGQAVWDLMLATSEAFANAVQHGTACSSGIGVRVETHDEGVDVEVTDCGRFDADVEAASLDATRGRGIHLIDAVVDEFEVVPDEHHTRVRFTKRSEVPARTWR